MDSQALKVAQWSLRPSQKQPAQRYLPIGPLDDDPDAGTTLVDDRRTVVDPQDIKPGGKYYSIVKLQLRYENQDDHDDRWAQGSGWLIQPDLLITAGHCAFDHAYSLGRAIQVKVYVGYDGKNSIGQPGVQFRNGARILTPRGWLESDVNRQNDVSLIQLESSFDNIQPITFRATPTQCIQGASIGVVGYPADKKDGNGEVAAQMYAGFKNTTWDLSVSHLNMLEYDISTFGGQSGSPVLVEVKGYAIGTHVYGFGASSSASVIRGAYGNFYASYQAALQSAIPSPTDNQGKWAVGQVEPTDSADAEGF